MRYRPQGLYRALCPYYVRDSRFTIACDCLPVEQAALRVEFEEPQTKTDFLRAHCFHIDGNKCPYRKLANED